MPVYNCKDFIKEAVDSLLGQTYANLELIIIDDCSTDGTLGILDKFSDDRIKLLKKTVNTGYIPSLNWGLEIAKGKYIARMDGDDISHPGRIEKQVEFLEQDDEIALCGTWYQLLATNEIVRNPAEHEDIKLAMLDYCALGHPTVMFRRKFIMDNKLSYDLQFYPAEDYDLWTRVAAIGKLANIPQVLLFYRTHAGQVSAVDQKTQVFNSYKCKVKMICYPLSVTASLDVENAFALVRRDVIQDRSNLDKMVEWLEYLLNSNQHSKFYTAIGFFNYIEQKKATLIRTYYLHQTKYNPGVFFKFNSKFRHYFTINELIRFTCKCALFWN